jgi:hypothetical protein
MRAEWIAGRYLGCGVRSTVASSNQDDTDLALTHPGVVLAAGLHKILIELAEANH